VRIGVAMTDSELLERIVVDPAVMVGKPVIRGTRLTVDFILNRLGHGSTIDELVEEYEGLTAEDFQSCLIFASRTISEVDFVPLSVP
jgi:uncharacterized protein (DUF433 family)